jgi:alcohol dehydrogenase (cytochrome c)
MNLRPALCVLPLCVLLAGCPLNAQSLNPQLLEQGRADTWPTYNGDYSGRRFSPLTKITPENVPSLSLAWVYRISAATGTLGGVIKSTPLIVDGVAYFSIPDHVFAIDARTGREIWHSAWNSKGGWHLGNRGVAMYHDTVYVETPDCNLLALNSKTGAERWHKQICDLDRYYTASVAPVVIGNHMIVGVSGDDLDIPGFLEARDPETGELQWHWSSVPKPGEPGSETWPNAEAMEHGGGMTWVPCTYDPELKLIYLGTGNPQPVIAGKARKGANLYTESIVALHVDTGKLAWYFQPSPHDTHDWDAVETPVLFDGEVDGQPRKLLAQASRNGFFFVLDRATGKKVVTSEFVKTNWAQGVDSKGQPIPNAAKEPQTDGALVTPNQGGAANWPPPSFSPKTGLFYVDASSAFSEYYIFDDTAKPEGWSGNDRGGGGESMLQALDYHTGKVRWSHKWEGPGARSGVLTTAANVLFTGDSASNLVALNAETGAAIWHANLGAAVSNGPISYELDGTQYVVAGAGDALFGFVMLSSK